MTRRVTTHDIAREAGVSRTTVSHILNNHPGIRLSSKTRERVLSTARELGYVNEYWRQVPGPRHLLPAMTRWRSGRWLPCAKLAFPFRKYSPL